MHFLNSSSESKLFNKLKCITANLTNSHMLMLFKYEDCCVKVTDCYGLHSLFQLRGRPISYCAKSDFLIILLTSMTEMAYLDGSPSISGNRIYCRLHLKCILVSVSEFSVLKRTS